MQLLDISISSLYFPNPDILGIFVYNFLSTCFLYNLCVLNWNLSDTILFGYLHLQISKTQNGCQNVKKPPYFLCFFAQDSTIDDFCKIFVTIFFLASLERSTFIWPLNTRCPSFFYIFTVTISIPLKMLTIVWFISANISRPGIKVTDE